MNKFVTFLKRSFPKRTIFAAITLVVSCNYSEDKTAQHNVGNGSNSELTDTTAFGALETNLFTPSCATCHGAASHSGGIDLTSFAGVANGKNDEGKSLVVPGKSAESLVYSVIVSGQMPPGGAKPAAALIEQLKSWIDAGAGENLALTPSPSTPPAATTPPPALEPTYASLAANVFTPNCVGCHNATRAAHHVRLDDYDALIASGDAVVANKPDESELLNQLVTGTMPPRGPAATAEQIAAVRAWIAAGAQRD